MPPKSPGGPIRLGARARVERAYQDWKWVVIELWEHKRHRLQTAARQRLLDKRAAHERQEAACQEAARATQCLLDKQAASNARRLCFANAFSMRRPLVANALPTHDRWRQAKSSSCGFAVDASMPGLLARPCGDSIVRPLLPACNMSRNAALAGCKRRNSVSRPPPCKQRR